MFLFINFLQLLSILDYIITYSKLICVCAQPEVNVLHHEFKSLDVEQFNMSASL